MDGSSAAGDKPPNTTDRATDGQGCFGGRNAGNAIAGMFGDQPAKAPSVTMRGSRSLIGIPGPLVLLLPLLAGCWKGPADDAFVRTGEKGFTVRGRDYYPLFVNYGLSTRSSGDSLWACPSFDYAIGKQHARANAASDLLSIKADMELIHDMGFNGVRLVGIGEVLGDDGDGQIRSQTVNQRDTLLPLSKERTQQQHMDAIANVLDMARQAGLRVVLTVYLRPGERATEEHFIRLADRFRTDTVIMAYDLFNEPLYFEKPENKKEVVDGICDGWRRLTKEHAPYQLTTIGLTGVREVFEWDPNRLRVDFVSYHPYEYEPDQVRNEMRWYHENMRVPWIIGETAIPADNDSVPYSLQKEFAQRTLERSRACGAWGYTWWQYKDVFWNYFHSDYMGVLNREGTTRTRKSGLIVQGTVKPVAEAFRSFDPHADPGPCTCLPNYFNYSGCRTSRLTGRLVDDDGDPIRSGMVIGWNEEWSHSYHTVTKDDGSFELDGCFYFHHWMASATGWSMVRGDCAPNGFIKDRQGLPTYYLGELTLDELPPHH